MAGASRSPRCGACVAAAILVSVALGACGTSATAIPPTSAIAATSPAATATAVPPTATGLPPTATPQPTATARTAEQTAPATELAATVEPTVAEPSGAVDGVVSPGEYSISVEAAGVTLYVRIEGDDLVGALVARTDGWVSVGFDPEDAMAGANYVYGYVTDGQAVVHDMFGTRPSGRDSHPLDTALGGTDDILEQAGSYSDGVTTIEFRIPLDSGDPYDKPLEPGGSYAVLLAMGPTADTESYHSARGEAMLVLAR